MPALGKPLVPPKPVVSTFKSNWPTKAGSQSYFESVLLGQVEGLSLEDEPSAANGVDVEHVTTKEPADDHVAIAGEDDDDAAGWDMGDDDVPEIENDFVNVDSAEAGGAGSCEADAWARNSPLAVDHVAGGSFESAMQLLNRQVGAVEFGPLKPRFLEVYRSSKTFLPALANLPPLVNYVRRTIDETDLRKVLPIIPRDLEHLASNDLQKGYDSMKANKLEDGVKIFQGILHAILVNAVSSESEVSEAKKLLASAREYTIAMNIELARRNLGSADEVAQDPAKLKKSLELAAYFTIPKIEVPHRQIALLSAIKVAIKSKNYNSALGFANRIIANGGSSKIVENVSRVARVFFFFFFFSNSDTNASRYRPRRRKLNARGTQPTASRLNLTSLQNLRFVPPATLQSTAEPHTKSAPLMAQSITLATRDLFAGCAEFARLASTVAA